MILREMDVFYMLFCYVIVGNRGGSGASFLIINVSST